MFSSCNECFICANSGGCLTGNGEDLFCMASKEKIIDNLDYGRFPEHEDQMIKTLKYEYGHDYDRSKCNSKKEENTYEYEPLNLEDINALF